MAHDGIGTSTDQAPIGCCESERTPEHQERPQAHEDAGELEFETHLEPPVGMGAVGPEKNGCESPPEGDEPVVEAAGHDAGSSSDQVGHDDEHLFGHEQDSDRPVGVQVCREGDGGEVARSRRPDQVRRDPQGVRRRRRARSPQEAGRPSMDGVGRQRRDRRRRTRVHRVRARPASFAPISPASAQPRRPG